MRPFTLMVYAAVSPLFLALACVDHIEPPVRTETIAGAPETPRNIQALVGDAEIGLTWEVSRPAAVRQFLIYRRDSLSAGPTLIDSTSSFAYRDRGVRNGVRYLYQIATHGTNGLVGKLSEPVIAAAGLYSVSLDNGRKYTASLSVSVNTAAPAGTRYMLLTNDTLAASPPWLSYAPERSWQLDPGDGQKRVFAKFRDFEGNETEAYSSDDIILDTRATIDSVTENSGGRVLAAGDRLHFKLYAGEPNGQATAEVPGVATVQLLDDGSSGDAAAGDGIYETDYTIPAAVDVIEELIVGRFADAAGNQADAVRSSSFISIANPPDRVDLSAYAVSESEIELVWTRAKAADFAGYLLFRADAGTVDTNDILLTNETNVSSTRFSDSDLDPATKYYYVVYTHDRSALLTASNVVEIVTMDNELPEAVELFVADKGAESVTLGWTKNNDRDFAAYQVYRATSPGVQTISENLKGVITSQNSTSFTDNDVEEETTYHYVTVVYDIYGAVSAVSNEVAVTTDASAK